MIFYAIEQFIELENLQTSIFAIASRSNTNDLHIHEVAQLSVPENGIIYSVVQEQLYVIPPTVAIYIPANTPHYIYKTNNNIIIENIYFSEKYFNLLPQITKEISLTDLTKILITQLCKTPSNQLDNNKAQQMLHLLLTELNENNNSPKYNLKIPTNESS